VCIYARVKLYVCSSVSSLLVFLLCMFVYSTLDLIVSYWTSLNLIVIRQPLLNKVSTSIFFFSLKI
jgi:hypothetical protein